MLKRNLIVTAILVLGLGVISVHAQDKLGNFEIQMVKKPKATVKKPKQLQPGNSGGTITNQRTSKNSLRKPCPTGYLIITLENCVKKPSGKGSSSRRKKPATALTYSKIEYVRKPRSVKGQTEYVDNDEYRTKKPSRKGSKSKSSSGTKSRMTQTEIVSALGKRKPQKRSTQKRQHKP